MYRILVVDDDPAVRETLTDILLSRDYAVERAEDGARALVLLEKTACDLIVLNNFMPEADGIEFLQSINNEEGRPPVITIVGGGGILPPFWTAKLTEALGAVSALTKPIDTTAFLSAVEGALRPFPVWSVKEGKGTVSSKLTGTQPRGFTRS